jgi:hypothetical protein
MKYGLNCEEIRERMPEVTAGFGELTAEENQHIESCSACAEQLKGMRATMALLDEWQAPEPSPYFDVRLQARLREEMARPQAGWLQWFRRPVLAAALTVLMGVGVGLFFMHRDGIIHNQDEGQISVITVPERGTAVSDLQDLEQNHDLYSNFEVLDELDVQQGAVANP